MDGALTSKFEHRPFSRPRPTRYAYPTLTRHTLAVAARRLAARTTAASCCSRCGSSGRARWAGSAEGSRRRARRPPATHSPAASRTRSSSWCHNACTCDVVRGESCAPAPSARPLSSAIRRVAQAPTTPRADALGSARSDGRMDRGRRGCAPRSRRRCRSTAGRDHSSSAAFGIRRRSPPRKRTIRTHSARAGRAAARLAVGRWVGPSTRQATAQWPVRGSSNATRVRALVASIHLRCSRAPEETRQRQSALRAHSCIACRSGGRVSCLGQSIGSRIAQGRHDRLAEGAARVHSGASPW